MNKIIKTILILALAGGIGLFLGFNNREVEVVVYQPNGEVSTSPASFVFGGGQLASGNDFKSLAENFPWYVSRASAITAYLLTFFIIFWGAGMTMGFIYLIANPVEAWVIHKYLGIAMGVTVLIHIFSLLFDRFINFKIWDILIPFYSGYKPLFLSLGIISFYLLLAVILTSLLIRLKSPKFWRTVHYAAYIFFIFALIHGLAIGTDSKTSAMRAVYWITGAMFLLLLAYRFIRYRLKNSDK